MIFFVMIISGILFSKFEIFNIGTWKENSVSFTIGFALWSIISGLFGTQSILSVTKNHLFATIAGELPQFIDVLMNGIVVPISEEIFWMFAIPYGVLSILNVLKKKYEVFNNETLQIIIVAIISASTFAIFHVGKSALTMFLISAVLFRSIMIILVFGDRKLDLIKKFNLVASFSVGAHIANNLFQGGITTANIVLQQNMTVYVIVITLASIIFLTTLNALASIIIKNKQGVKS